MLNVPTTYQYYSEIDLTPDLTFNFKETKLCFSILFVLCASI